MIRTRWIKVLIDLWSNRSRTLVVALAIAVGVYAVGTVISARLLLVREYESDQEQAKIASAIIRTYPFDSEFAERIGEFPSVVAAEGRNMARVYTYDDQGVRHDLVLVAISDFYNIQVDAPKSLEGDWPPGRRQVILERLSPEFIDAGIGDSISVELDNNTEKQLKVVGLAHDSQRLNPQITDTAFGYVTPETMGWLGFGETFTQLHLIVADHNKDESKIRTVTDLVEKQIEDSGRPIISTSILTESVIQPYIDTVVAMLTIFGIIILLLSGFLVVNSITALITQQIQQIGIMKLIGARRTQILAMYGLLVLAFGIIAILIGIPLATLTARLLMTNLIEELVNIMPDSYTIPASIISIEIAIGLLLPLMAGLIPALKGTSITTQQALNHVGIANDAAGKGLGQRLFAGLQAIRSIQRPVLLAIRNTLRHKGRLAQTLLVLIVGTALFISVLSVRSSVSRTLVDFLRYHQYDVSIQFDRSYRIDQLEYTAKQSAAVATAEAWSIADTFRVRPDDSESDNFRLMALPPDTAFMDPIPSSGRWLQTGESATVVINSDVVDDEPDLRIGDEMVLDIGGRESTWRIVGIVPTDSEGPAVYINRDDYGFATREPGYATNVQVAADDNGSTDQIQLEAQILSHFQEMGYEVSKTETAQAINVRNELMFDIVVAVLILMALLLAAVGGLGLTTTMSINVLERIREIGVLRAIGASNMSVRQIILAEGIVIGALGWILGTCFSIPISAFLSEQVGLLLLNIPLSYVYSTPAAIGWFFAVMAIAVVASLGPARNAVRLTIREVLAYE
ncbi:MAG: ABC transporter permease [Anaerolineales bacterium]|nr:ABC transporter permease [Anaerolineales bacterium]